MNHKPVEKFTISQAALIFNNDKCLILEAAPGTKYAGKVGFAGGRIDEGEAGKTEKAFARELKEELGVTTFEIVGLVDFDTWYNGDNIARAAIVRYIKTNSEHIVLSGEHSNFYWITEEEVANFEFAWPHAKQIIKKGFAFHRNLKK